MLPKRLSDTCDRIYLIGNPRGYGKSALVAEMAYRRKELCERKNLPSGPVLFTDFKGAKSAFDAEKKVLETIRPLFLTLFSFIPVALLPVIYEGGNVSKFFLLFFSLSFVMTYTYVCYNIFQ